jgi:hypothetical protein
VKMKPTKKKAQRRKSLSERKKLGIMGDNYVEMCKLVKGDGQLNQQTTTSKVAKEWRWIREFAALRPNTM